MKKRYFTLIAFLFLSFANAQIVNIPDANFKAKLLSASFTNQVASTQIPYYNTTTLEWTVSTYNKIDTNNDGEIQVSEASLIKYLKVRNSNISGLEGISFFSNLFYLNCSGNQISTLNVSGMANLKYLNCIYNQMANLNMSGMTNLNTLNCSNNQLTNINVSDLNNLQELNCSINQLINLDVSGLTNLFILQCSSNQLQSINVNLSGLFTLKCGLNQLTTLDVSNASNLNDLDCRHNQLTTLFMKNNLPAPDVTTHSWGVLYFNFNPNLTYICSNEVNFALIQEQINQYGYTNCNLNSYCSFTPGGIFYTIDGNNKLDANNNGCETNDSVYPNLKFNITDGTNTGSLISNALGSYSIPVSTGTHTITPQLENPTYFTSSPSSTTVSFPATASPFVQDFCIVPNGIHHDLEIVVIPVNAARPGFDATYKIKYKNKGNQSENATVNFNYNDAFLDYVSSSVAPTTQATGTLSWSVGTIAPFQSGEILVTLNVNSPMETPAVNDGDILSYYATAIVTTTDETSDDNTAVLSQIVVNSFDPNDKTCLEGNVINPSMIGKYVHYKIRFENTGAFAAQNIVVKDIIDTTKFDIATLQMTDASHSCVTKISNTNKVEFIFENINLPFDDANNDGYVVFKIKTKPTLTLNSTISNLANIYFDYNFPIVTNTATSTFTTLGNDTFEFDNFFTIYPNPVAEVLSIKAKQNTKILSLSIYTTLGQLVQTVVNPTSTLDVSDLKTGTYFVKITTDNGVASNKFVKE